MVTSVTPQFPRLLKSLSRFAGIAVLGVGSLVIVGWLLDVPTLKGAFPGFVTMKFNTAVCFALAGLTLLLLQREPRHPWERPLARISAVVIALIGLLTCCEYLFGWDLGIDQWVVREPSNALQALYPGRMSPITAFNFLFLGSSLLLAGHPRSVRVAQGLALTALFLSLLAGAGYLYGAEELYRVSVYTSVALPTAIILLVLCFGILFVRPERGLVAVIASQNAGGIMARRLLLVSICLPILLGWLALQGVNVGLYDAAFSASVAALSGVITLSMLILWNARSLGRMDEALRKSYTDLERQVEERTADLRETNRTLEAEVLQRQQTETVLAEERNLLRTLIDNLPDYIYVKDRHSRFINANLALAMSLGASAPEDIIGKTDLDYHPPELAARYFADEQALFASGESLISHEEPAFDHQTGKTGWYLSTKVPLRNSQGEITGLVGIGRDITQRREAEAALDSERRLLRTLIDNLPDYIFTKDRAGRFTLSNLAHARAAHAASPEELIGKTAFEVFPGELATQFHADDLAIMDSGQSLVNVERATIGERGDPRVVLTTKVPLHDSSGTTVGLVGISHDITPRRRVEQALRDSETRLAGILETAHEAIISIDEDQRIILYNAGAEQVFGYSREEAIGRSLDVLLPDRTRAIHRTHVAGFAETGIMARRMGERQEIYGLRKDGQEFAAEASISKLNMEGNRVFTVVLRDITPRKQAEEALRRSEAAEHEQRMLAETLRDTALALTANLEPEAVIDSILTNIERVVPHDAAEIMSVQGDAVELIAWRGYSAEAEATLREFRLPITTPNLRQMIATHAPVLIPDTEADPGWVKSPELGWTRACVGAPIEIRGQVIGFLILTSAQPGFFTAAQAQHLHIFAAQVATALDNARLVEALRGYATDLEQRVEERTLELQQAKESVEAILNHSSDAILVVSADGAIRQANPTFSDLFGVAPDAVQRNSLMALAGQEGARRLEATLSSVIQNGTSERIEIEAVRQDGTSFSADVGLAPIRRRGEVVCSIRDITERKKVERELQELSRLKTEFMSTAAHELRTPLASIVGFSELLVTREMDTGRARHYIQVIHEQSNQLATIIDALLDISRLEARQGMALDLAALNLAQVITKTLSYFDEYEPKYQFQLNDIAGRPPVMADSGRLEQVFRNLLSNAVKYSPKGGMITIRGQSVPGFIQITVQDQGIGMTAQQQTHLFERFYRADTSNTTISGTGLGLAICKLIIELHGGKIWAESEYGVGTTIHLTLLLPTEPVPISNQPL